MKINKILMILLFMISITVEGCTSHSKKEDLSEWVAIQHGPLKKYVNVSGLVSAKKKTHIFSNVFAKITEYAVSEGKLVKKGDTLIRFDTKQYEESLIDARKSSLTSKMALSQAMHQYELSTEKLNESNSFYNNHSISLSQLNTQKAETEYCKKNLDLQKQLFEINKQQYEQLLQKEKSFTIVSNIDGQVLTVSDQLIKGNYVKEGQLLAIIGDVNNVQVELDLNEMDSYFVKKGQSALIKRPYSENEVPIQGCVSEISPLIENGKCKVSVKFTNDHRFKIGAKAEVDILVDKKENAYYVPIEAVIKKDEQTFVQFQNVQNQKLTTVNIGINTFDFVEILPKTNLKLESAKVKVFNKNVN